MRGRNAFDTEYVKAGAYHTLEIEPQRAFEIHKFSWDVLDLDRLQQACDPAASADLAAVLITVGGGFFTCKRACWCIMMLELRLLIKISSWCLTNILAMSLENANAVFTSLLRCYLQTIPLQLQYHILTR